jgi:serine/threonine-protein kinase SRK2
MMTGKARYHYVRRLGSGSYGDVVLAAVEGAHKHFAVKCLRLDTLSQRTLVEIQNHKKLVHPHVIRFEEVFEDDQGLYIVMEYAELGNLLSYVQQQPHSRLSEKVAR